MVAVETGSAEALNPVDATLWAIRRDPELRTTIVALALLDHRPDWATLRSAVERAVERIPRLRQRVSEPPMGMGRPHWVDAEPDLDFHLRRVAAPAPGGLRSALDICGSLAGEDFDEARPLWEAVLMEGIDDDQAALVLKVSHSLTDGVGGMALLRLLDDQAGESDEPPGGRRGADRHGLPAELLSLPSGLVSAAVHAGLHPVETLSDVAAVAGSATRLLSPAGPPLSSLMTDRSLNRWSGVSELSFERLYNAAHRAGGTVNDAFVTIAMGALADYHHELGVDGRGFRVTMPVSFRSDDDAAGGNQWTPARVVLEVDRDAHPFDELMLYRQVLRVAAREPAVSFTREISSGLQQLPASLTSGIVAGVVKGSDVALTDVPGLGDGLKIAGVGVTRLFPFAPTGGAAVNIGLVSHRNTACIGFTVDTAAVSDPDRLVRCFDRRAGDFLRRRRPAQVPRSATTAHESGRRGENHPERLSALDTGFLRMEAPTTPMHMGVLCVIDGAPVMGADGELDRDAIKRHVEARVALTPRLTKRLEEVPLELGRPVWVDDPDFEIDQHVHFSALPPPGGRAQLIERCEQIQMERLDRTRALFDMHFITGLDDDEFGADAIALVEKVHHALLDGMSGVELMVGLFDVDPVVAAPEGATPQPRPASAGARPSSFRLLGEAALDLVQEPMALTRSAAAALRSPRRTMRQLGTTVGALGDLMASGRSASPALTGPVGDQRRLEWISVPLASVHDTGVELGGTVNDVVLAAVTGGLRALLSHRGQPLDEVVKALVPVSTRHVGMDVEQGNHVAALVVELPVDLGEPVAGLMAVSSRVRDLKAHHHADGTEVLLDVGNHVPAVAMDLVSRLIGHQHMVNLVVTNLPGPATPLFFSGGEVRQVVPIVPLGGNLTVGIAVLSYAGDLVLAFHADRDACPDIEVMATATRDGFSTLAERAGLS